jgi:hypothetical protein
MDSNKTKRDRERRLLQKNGWEAFLGFKRDGSTAKKWIWLHPNHRKPVSRREAVKLTKKGEL